MVDVHAGVTLQPLADHGQEVDERLALTGAVVRPEWVEFVSGGEDAPQVFESPFAAVECPQRVALEVEEQITLVRVGQHHQGLRVDDLVGRFAIHPRGGLQPRLRGQRCHGASSEFGHGTGVPGELRDGGDACVDEAGALAHPHSRDQQQVVMGSDLDLALRTAEACPHVLVLPRDRRAAGKVVVEQPLKPGAPAVIHGKQFVDAVSRRRAVAEHQLDLGRHRHAGPGQGVGVGG